MGHLIDQNTEGRHTRSRLVVAAVLAVALLASIPTSSAVAQPSTAPDDLWSVDKPEYASGYAVAAEIEQILIPSNTTVHRFGFDGRTLPVLALSARVTHLEIVGTTLYAGTTAGISEFSLISGAPGRTWSIEDPGAFTVLENTLWFVDDRTFARVDLITGAIEYEVVRPETPSGPLALRADFMTATSDGRILFVDSGDAHFFDAVTLNPLVTERVDVDRGAVRGPGLETVWLGGTEYTVDDLNPTGRAVDGRVTSATADHVVVDGDRVVDASTGAVAKQYDRSGESVVMLFGDYVLTSRPFANGRNGSDLVAHGLGPTIVGLTPEFYDPRSGPDVTILGIGLSQTTSVTIAGEPVAFSIISDHAVEVAAPVLAPGETRQLVVQTADSATTSNAWTYRGGPAAGRVGLFLTALDGEVRPRDRDEPLLVELNCRSHGRGERTEYLNDEFVIPAGSTTNRAVKPGTTCWWHTVSGPLDSAGSIVGDHYLVSDDARRFEFEVGRHGRHVAVQLGRREPVLTIATVATGQPPPGTELTFRVRCPDSSDMNTTVAMGPIDQVDITGPFAGDCAIIARDLGGAISASWVHTVQGEPADTLSGIGSATVRPGAGRRITYRLEFPPARFQYPLVVGSPGEDLGTKGNAGLITVIPTDADGLPRPQRAVNVTQKTAGVPGINEKGDQWGEAIAVGDFNLDGNQDIAVGAPRENVGRVKDAGSVTILYNNGRSPTADAQLFTRNTAGVAGAATAYDRLGSSLATVYWDNDAFPDLAVGIPGHDFSGAKNAGAVLILYGGPNGLSSRDSVLLTENHRAIGETAETHDRFGSVLDGHGRTLVIGVPLEDIGGDRNAGIVYLVRGWGDRRLKLNQGRGGGAREAGDLFGASLDFNGRYLMVGAPGETIGSKADAGAFSVITIPSDWYRHDRRERPISGDFYSRNHQSIAGAATAGDRVGASAVLFDRRSFLVGAPGARADGVENAGVVLLWDNRYIHSDNPGVPGAAETDDRLGDTMALARGVVMVGVPGEAIGTRDEAGAVLILGLTTDFVASYSASTTGIPGKAEAGDGFGSSLAGS